MTENETAIVTLSTIFGPFDMPGYQIGKFVAHAMLADDLPLRPCPHNGYAISLAANGKRLSWEFRTFRGMAHAVNFARELSAAHDDWERWFDEPAAPSHLLDTFHALHDAAKTRGELTNLEIIPS